MGTGYHYQPASREQEVNLGLKDFRQLFWMSAVATIAKGKVLN